MSKYALKKILGVVYQISDFMEEEQLKQEALSKPDMPDWQIHKARAETIELIGKKLAEIMLKAKEDILRHKLEEESNNV